ncbi:melanophilin a isoform X3 [Oreochromis niloticus]|uniref:melanophilin a isoform X3 n=1 Tax=Oreochromis niloticus TaxID=8128 RepID=UPI000DF49B8E|nr:melanophilin isoform X3 [Oreochromis niloticus]
MSSSSLNKRSNQTEKSIKTDQNSTFKTMKEAKMKSIRRLFFILWTDELDSELKNKIEKEDSKRELLGSQSNLSDSLCIRCLQPFKFLVNSKRQCLDCRMYTCKSCSRYNKKEHGWVCDNCRMNRVLKIGTLGWYHDNVRNRFKRFGSAKVMRSLYKRLNGEGGRDDDTQSMPDVHNHAYNGNEDDQGEFEGQRYKVMRKNKRLLSVHPMDFDNEDYLPHSRRPSVQQDDRYYRNDVDYDHYSHRGNRRKSLDRYAMRPDDNGENRMVRTRSLSKITSSVARQQYVDTSDEEEYQRYPQMYQQPPHRRRGSRTSSQENLGQAPPINELSKRMSAIETLLSRLEEKITPGVNEASNPSAQNEEEKLRRKLSELAGNLSDKGPSSDDEAGKKSFSVGKGLTRLKGGPAIALNSRKDKELSSSSDEMPTEAQKRSTAAALCDLTTEVLRTINATENAMVEYGLSEPIDRSHLVGTDVKQADDAFRELEENVSLQHELHASLSLKPNPPPRPKHDGNVWTGFNPPGCCVSVHQRQGWCRSNTLGPVTVQFESSYSSSRFRKRLHNHLKHAPEQLVKLGLCSLLPNSLKVISKNG